MIKKRLATTSLKKLLRGLFSACVLSIGGVSATQAAVVLYENDFENPTGFSGGAAYTDVDQQSIQGLYGTEFTQNLTVETIHITGALYTDALGTGGNYALGMLESLNDDRLWLTFDVTGYDFLNIQLDLSSIDLQGNGFPFVNGAPTLKLNLRSGSNTGTILDSEQTTGASLASSYIFNWTNEIFSLSTGGASSVTLEFDLISGGYASFDNLVVAASDIAGDVTAVPIPAAAWLFGSALIGLLGLKRKS